MPFCLVFLASLAAAPPAPPPPIARATAQVSARIVAGARIDLGRSASEPGHLVRSSTITAKDGSKRPARLVEFE